ncbi:Anti-sigma B factor RsbT [Minicystis rosea]|nr:Anti-sigma B factor RsbT [Minicystis rosea]
MRSALSEAYVVPLARDPDIVLASDYARRLADAAGMGLLKREALRTAVVEIVHNVLRFARRGEARLRLVGDGSRTGVEVVVCDTGPGLPLAGAPPGPRPAGAGLGAGLGAARRLVDEFHIESSPLKGTTVVMVKWTK